MRSQSLRRLLFHRSSRLRLWLRLRCSELPGGSSYFPLHLCRVIQPFEMLAVLDQGRMSTTSAPSNAPGYEVIVVKQAIGASVAKYASSRVVTSPRVDTVRLVEGLVTV